MWENEIATHVKWLHHMEIEAFLHVHSAQSFHARRSFVRYRKPTSRGRLFQRFTVLQLYDIKLNYSTTSQRAVTTDGWRVKAGMVRMRVAGETVWSRCIHGPYLSALETGHNKALYKFTFFMLLFTSLHGMQKRTIATRKVSVRPSICQTRDLWQNETKKNICQHSYSACKTIHPSFVTRRMVGGSDPFYPKFRVKLTPLESENADFQPIFACSASAVTPSEKSSINANRKPTTRFPMSLRWSS